MQLTKVAVGLAGVLVASGCLQRPASSRSGAVSDGPAWDESASVEAGGQDLVMTGPVLHRSVASAPGAVQVLSRRCYFISLGIGFLVELDANERAQHDGTPMLESVWQPEQLVAARPCERAFGASFRLPTSAEADAWLARNNESGPIFSRDAGALGSVKRDVSRCEVPRDCAVNPPVHGPPQPATLRCVGPLPARASAVPNESEVRECVGALQGVAVNQGDKLAPLDPGSLDVILLARQACVSGGVAYQQLHDALRSHVGLGTIVAMGRRASADRRVLTEALATLHWVLGEQGATPSPLDCETAPGSYQRACHDPLARECLLLQARFAQQCRQRDPLSQLASTALAWDAEMQRTTDLEQEAATLMRAAAGAVRCSMQDPAAGSARQSLLAVLGVEARRVDPPRPICPCVVEDLDCGLAALHSRGICSENQAPAVP